VTDATANLERAAAQTAVARENLINTIREARAAGMSLRAIASLVGLSAETVRHLSNNEEAA
jgi:orotate phosphoribosyltransferase-like protein